MKPKTQVALKLKTLTLTLALTAGMSAGIAMGYTAGTEGQKALEFGANMEKFLGYYSAYDELDITTTNGDTATGAFSAKSITKGTGSSSITGGHVLTKGILEELNTAAAVLDAKASNVAEAIGAVAPSEKALTALKAKLSDLDPAAGTTTAAGVAGGVKTALSAALGGSVYTNGANSLDLSNHSGLTTEAHIDNIDTLNNLVDYFYKGMTNAGTATPAGAGLDTAAKRTAFFNYAAAYLDHKDTTYTATDKTAALGGSVTDADLTPLAKELLKLLDTGVSSATVTANNFTKLTTDAELDTAIALTDADIAARIATLNKTVSQKANVDVFKDIKTAGAGDTAKLTTATNEIAAKITPNVRSNTSLAQVASKAAMNNVSSHMQAVQAGVNSGDNDYANGNVWLRTNYLQQDVDKQDSNPAYKQKSIGAGIGVDQQLNDKFTMGLSYNFVRSDVDGKDGYVKEDDVKSHAFGGYISMMHDNIFADAQVNYVKNKVDGFRGAAADKVTYKYDGEAFNTMIGVGVQLDLDNHWYAKPKLCFASANYKTDKYDETGTGVTALNVDAANHQSSEVGLQLILGADLMMSSYTFKPKFNLGFMYDLNDKKDKVTFSILGADMTSEGPKRDRANYNFGLGAGFVMDQLFVNLDYGFNFSSNTKTHLAAVKLGYMF